jgi:hypothetical protein
MNTDIRARCRTAMIMAGFLALAAALSMVLGSGTDNVRVPGGQGIPHDEIAAIHTARLQNAGRGRPGITGSHAVACQLRHAFSAPALLDPHSELI